MIAGQAMPTASLSLFPLPVVDVSLPSRCDGLLPNGRRCMVRGTRRVAGGLYCRHHVPTKAIRFDAAQGMRDDARFAGAGIESAADTVRLKGQLAKISAFCLDGQEHTVAEIAAAVQSMNAGYRRQCVERRKESKLRDSLIRAQARAGIPLQVIAERHGLLLHPVQCIVRRHRGYQVKSI